MTEKQDFAILQLKEIQGEHQVLPFTFNIRKLRSHNKFRVDLGQDQFLNSLSLYEVRALYGIQGPKSPRVEHEQYALGFYTDETRLSMVASSHLVSLPIFPHHNHHCEALLCFFLQDIPGSIIPPFLELLWFLPFQPYPLCKSETQEYKSPLQAGYTQKFY